MKRIFRKILLASLDRAQDDLSLRYLKQYQVSNFENIWRDFGQIASSLMGQSTDSPYVDHNWRNWCKNIAELYGNKNHLLGFTQHPIIIKTMTGEPVLDRNRDLLLDIIPELRRYVSEELIGNNLLVNTTFKTSTSRVAHLYVASLIVEISRKHSIDLGSITELGGGFGGLMSIFLRRDRDLKFSIFDLPEVLPLQYVYINTVCRYESSDPLISDKAFQAVQSIRSSSAMGSVFISNWALTESTKSLQDLAVQSNFFSASAAFICCEDNNENHSDSRYIHDYLKDKSSYAVRLKGTMSNSMLYFIDLC